MRVALSGGGMRVKKDPHHTSTGGMKGIPALLELTQGSTKARKRRYIQQVLGTLLKKG